MISEEFLARFGVDEGGHFVASLNSRTKKFTQKRVDNVGQAVDLISTWAEQRLEIYYSMASFTGVSRTSATTKAINAFWLDVEAGDEKFAAGQGYKTKEAALVAVQNFCKATKIPAPNLLVDSGNGWHIYWQGVQVLNRDEWVRVASKFKLLIADHGLIADPTRTADTSSILRVPGTHNFKDSETPKPVLLRLCREPIDLDAFVSRIDALMPDEGDTKNPLEIAGVANHIFEGNLTVGEIPTPENVQRVRSALAAVSADCEYGTWRDVIWSVIATGWPDAVDMVREWSQTVPDKFDETAFTSVVESFKPGGIGVGTLFHLAAQAGWQDPRKANSDELTAALEAMNDRYFVSRVGGGVFAFDKLDENLVAGGMAFSAFKNFHAGHRIDGVQVASKWVSWAGRRTFQSITFDPSGRCGSGDYNLWQGLAVTPVAGECGAILRHIREVWCSCDEAQTTYVLGWMALAVQRPSIKPEVALVLRSREGSGKTTITDILLKIFGRHGFTAAQKKQVVGGFNGHLMDKVLVVLEEAFFAGDPEAVASAKVLITNKSLGYESKGKDAINAASFHHVIALTNHKWAVPAGEDSRRWAVLDVSDSRRGDHTYFENLHAEIDSGGVSAFLAFLLALDLTGYNPRQVPQTQALADQRLETLRRTDAVAAWWSEVLADCSFDLRGRSIEWDTEIAADDVRESYELFTARLRHAPPWSAAARRLRELCPQMNKVRRRTGIGRAHFYELPGLEVARSVFAQLTGVQG